MDIKCTPTDLLLLVGLLPDEAEPEMLRLCRSFAARECAARTVRLPDPLAGIVRARLTAMGGAMNKAYLALWDQLEGHDNG